MNKNKILIDRPLAFLCGPSYQRDSIKDRRNILSTFISSLIRKNSDGTIKFEFLPIIIDDVFDKEEMGRLKLSFKIIEEILSAISFKTYIFLDSMSTSYEYGLFDNSLASNEAIPFLENDFEKRKRRSIGAYIKLAHSNTNFITYNAKKNFKEFINFKTNECPKEIQEKVKKDENELYEKLKNGNNLNFISALDKRENELGDFYYLYNSSTNQIVFETDVKTSFYFMLNIFKSKEINFFVKNNKISIAFSKMKQDIFKNFVASQPKLNSGELTKILFKKPSIQLNIGAFKDAYQVLKHEFYLAYRMNNILSSKSTGGRMLTSKSFNYSFKLEAYNFFSDALFLNNNDIKFLKNTYYQPYRYYDRHLLKFSSKRRLIITYKNNNNGKRLKEIHNNINNVFTEIFEPSDHSFAYHKNFNTMKCCAEHLMSSYFIKMDIQNFFNSITIDKMSTIISKRLKEKVLKGFAKYMPGSNQVKNILSGCFYNNTIPLGLVSSPILSDIYLNEMDTNITSEFKDIIYTRYADDILISSKNGFHNLLLCKDRIVDELTLLNLKLNDKKNLNIYLNNDGDSIHFIGINIVKRKNGNELTISKSFMSKWAYYINKNFDDLNKDSSKTKGIIHYIRNVSEKSYNKFLKMLLCRYNIVVSRDYFLTRNVISTDCDLPF